jgi:creatinine amidohydrolase
MMLALRPELVVGDLSQVAEVPFGEGGAPGYRGWTTPDRSQPGHIGRPSAASAEKGEALFNAFAAGVASFLERTVAWKGSEWNL